MSKKQLGDLFTKAQRFKIPKELSVLLYSGRIYDNHFIIKELTEEFEEQLSA